MKSKDKGNSKLSELPQRFFLNKDFHEAAEVRTGKTPPCPASAAAFPAQKAPAHTTNSN